MPEPNAAHDLADMKLFVRSVFNAVHRAAPESGVYWQAANYVLVFAVADPRAQAVEAARQRAAQERDAARTSSVFLGSGGARAGAEPVAAPGLPAPSGQEPAQQAAQGDQAGKRAFMAQASNQRTWPAPIRWPSSNLMHGGLSGHG